MTQFMVATVMTSYLGEMETIISQEMLVMMKFTVATEMTCYQIILEATKFMAVPVMTV